jgi:hypothetical protein
MTLLLVMSLLEVLKACMLQPKVEKKLGHYRGKAARTECHSAQICLRRTLLTTKYIASQKDHCQKVSSIIKMQISRCST